MQQLGNKNVYKENGLSYTGSGVLIIEDYYKKNGLIEPSIIIVRNRSSQLYMDFGGGFEEKHKTLQMTAKKELQEESRNLILIDTHNINNILTNFVDIPVTEFESNLEYYRVYVIKVNGISRKQYHGNKNKIDDENNMNVPKYWKETDDIAHIPIKNIDFDKLNQRGTVTVKDVSDRTITLHRRVKKAIYYAKSIINNSINTVAISKKVVIHKSDDFLNDTCSFVIM